MLSGRAPRVHDRAEVTSHRLGQCEDFYFYAEDVLSDDPVWLEVGCYGAKHPRCLYQKHGGRVIIYDASQSNFEKLQQAVEGLPFTLHNEAVTGEDGSVRLYEFRDRPSSHSVMRRMRQWRKLRVERSYEVRTVSIATALDENGVDQLDALFLDCEGAELPIMDELAGKPELWSRIRQVCVETHPQIYGRRPIRRLYRKFAPRAAIIEGPQERVGCTLFINREWSKLP